MRRKKSITLNLRNITPHFAGKEKIITLSFVILMLSLANITLTSALSYQTETDISFTFNPTISISLSSSDLVIPSLTPGTIAESNSINVSVATNAAYGYTLSVNASSENLTHSDNVNAFDSIAADSDLPDLITDNTWGYSTSLDNGVSWSNYNGLSSANTRLADINHLAENTINFKIAAKASNIQPSGIYTNTINFIAVAKPTPQTITDLEYLQDFARISTTDLNNVKNSMPKNFTFMLKDQRDEQGYTIAKLEDGKIWMTKNLNLAGETEITSKLSDVSEGYILPASNGFQEDNKLPASSQSGFGNWAMAYVYNTGKDDTDDCSSPGCYSYYSWTAATAGSGISIVTDNMDAPYSICPKGWRLPTSRSTVAGNSDFYQLAVAYGMSPGVISQYTSNFYYGAGPGTVPNFLMEGYYYHGSFSSGNQYARYWSSTSNEVDANGDGAYELYFYWRSNIDSAKPDTRRRGSAIRCLAR